MLGAEALWATKKEKRKHNKQHLVHLPSACLLEQQCVQSMDPNNSVGKWVTFLSVKAMMSCNLKFGQVSLCSSYQCENSTVTWAAPF